VTREKEWSPVPLAICELCAFAWTVIVFAGAAYAVFWLDRSGWWFLLAMLLANGWNCKVCQSPEQIRARKQGKKS
jgi:hypothetical protein